MWENFREFIVFLKEAPRIVQIVGVISIVFAVYLVIRGEVSNHGKGQASPAPVTATATVVIAKSTATSEEYDPGNGRQTEGPSGASSVGDRTDAMLQKAAAAWHNKNSEKDNPPWKYISNDHLPMHLAFVKYRYFSKSDGCLDIQRAEVGHDAVDKWVPNPLLSVRALHPDNTQQIGKLRSGEKHENLVPPEKRFGTDSESLLESLASSAKRQIEPWQLKPVLAAVLLESATNNGALRQPIQVPNGPQYCLNPHPGQYTWYWGTPVGCQLPQFRTFTDNCQHYQIFNTCTGVWEPQIYWTFCRAH